MYPNFFSNPFTSIYLCGVIFIAFFLVADWIRQRKRVRRFNRYGWIFVSVAFLLSIPAILFLSSDTAALFYSGQFILSIGLSYGETFVLTVMGLFYSSKIGITSLPLIFRLWPLPPPPVEPKPMPDPVLVPKQKLWTDVPLDQWDSVLEEDSSLLFKPEPKPVPVQKPRQPLWSDLPLEQPDSLSEMYSSAQVEVAKGMAEVVPGEITHLHAVPDYIPSTSARPAILAGMIAAAGFVLYTITLFLITRPVSQQIGSPTNISGVSVLLTLLSVVGIAIKEEIFFRLGIQNMVAFMLNLNGNKYWAGIILASLLWTLGHTGVLHPDWVKYVQIFPIGLALGWMYRKYGLESSMLAHGLFNVLAYVFLPWLV